MADNRLALVENTVKILFVTRETEPERRYGLGRSLLPLVNELEKRGHQARYLCQGDLSERNLRVLRRVHLFLFWLFGGRKNRRYADLSWTVMERMNMGRLAAKVAARDGYTHVHFHDPIIAAGYLLFPPVRLGGKSRWGVSEHGYGSYIEAIHKDGIVFGRMAMRWAKKLEARVLRAASWVIAPTQAALEKLAEDLGFTPVPESWRAVYHAKPQLQHYNKTDARKRLGWDNAHVYIIGVGRLAPVKQFPLLIEACAKLQGRYDNIQLVLAGEGDRLALQNYASTMRLQAEIIFTVTDDIGLYLSAADIYVSVSASESFGIANLEAMVAGIPVVCTAVGGVPEVVGDGAMLIQPDIDSLTNVLQQVMDDANLRERLAQQGRRRGAAWPDIAFIADCYEEIYRPNPSKKDRLA